MTIPILRCSGCIHYESDGTCKAFPDGIPLKIISGINDHSEPLPVQDNDIVYSPIDKTTREAI